MTKPLSEMLEAMEPKNDENDYDMFVVDRKSYDKLKAVAIELAKACEFYSGIGDEDVVIQWGKLHSCDSYSGGNYLPDWNGDLQDEPGEIAVNALSRAKDIIGGE